MIIFILFWLLCSVLAYGFTFAFMQGEVPETAKKCYRQDREMAFVMSLFGPLGLIVIFSFGGIVHGLKYW